jgi:arsenate reductase
MNSHRDERPWRVLFLCTGNSARSIIAESLLRHWGGDRFEAHSAGSAPGGSVQPLALELLERHALPTDGLHSKSLDVYTGTDAPTFDFVITVCDHAAEQCPMFPGQPITAHWGLPDPARVEGDEAHRMQAYRNVMADFERRIKLFLSLPLSSLDRLASQSRVRAIGDAKETKSA